MSRTYPASDCGLDGCCSADNGTRPIWGGPADADHASTLARVPIFLAALLVVRGLPTLAYRPFGQPRQLVGGALLEATSLSIPVVAGQIGVDLHLISAQSYIALVAAGLLSVIVFPLLAVPLLPGRAVRSRPGVSAATRLTKPA